MSAWLAAGWSWVGAGLGLLFAAGAIFVARGMPASRRIGLDDRLGPYLLDTAPPSALLAATRAQSSVTIGLGHILEPYVRDAARFLGRLLGGDVSVRRRQLRAGVGADVEAFRAEQVLWGAAGAGVGLLTGAAVATARGTSPLLIVGWVLTSTLIGIVAKDQLLTRAANRREQGMLAEFPTIAELLALAVAAGEGATGALERVCRLSRGELARELRMCLADARAGANLPTALQGLADRTGLLSLSRFVDGMVVAVERGTPLADVLRAQAQDVREVGRRAVMEAGGRKEISMMLPVVFMVLPVTVLFAVYPGFVMLSFTL